MKRETYHQKAKRLGITGLWSTMDLLNEIERMRDALHAIVNMSAIGCPTYVVDRAREGLGTKVVRHG